MIDNYLKSLIDSLDRKKTILDELIRLSNRQQEIVSETNVDWDEFDKTIDAKSELIDELNQLDEGFEAVFDRIKDGLVNNKVIYASKIKTLQDGIREVTDKSTALMALEERTNAKVTNGFAVQRKTIRQGKVSTRAAANYYNSMNRINYIDPQLMDKKK